ncbi:hypothetical protein BATDEDRAFT_85865 [Batrachochytrium dendrobatidis JAM81]|uniref:Ribosomal protein S21 n=2 Tax=Batrachochytrium dendrobatidis TaxID=109871 RepID=F4NRI5_BATDJ|nr:uncharacterized protein BATDEDRAFT_85865 [Batrachochytrium dendrobatidis JAM81]EGF83347.1 hypothetical protein BATDEDRAFT_85865 [Batrachochytrium dendrobatidis JAM81]KAJ8326724.1 hypothetical protein O5D80_004177 [Batrachochytrium dendrobatidis]KAK5668471.1 hypothetical protein QVD99_005489 [Batrachochytrium dendrobatidis]|eukprot:XP_006676069.1 hypothetical protein BATDEDRAFT_85865 [Batrachochytrium dendrobatidis JAM81]
MLTISSIRTAWSRLAAGPSMAAPIVFSLLSTPVNITHSSRGFKKHMGESLPQSAGRSVVVKGTNSTQAYFQLRRILEESNFRALVRGQERFESNPDKRRRKRKERDWAIYMAELRRQTAQARDLTKRHEREKEHYRDI